MKIYRFLDFVLDEKSGTLLKNKTALDIRPKAWQGLKILLEGSGSLISQKTLIEKIWHDQDVSPKALTNLISDIRQILQDDEQTKIITTIVRRGYVFTPEVIVEEYDNQASLGRQAPENNIATGGNRDANKAWNVVGRDSELMALQRALGHAAAGHRQVILIEGTSGTGKSTLLLEFQKIALAQQWDFQWCNSIDSLVESESFGPMIRFIQTRIHAHDPIFLAGQIEKIAPCWAIQFPAIFPPSYVDKLSLQLKGSGLGRMLREGCTLIHEMVKRRPLVLVFDDIQWADAATLELISTLIQSSQDMKLLLIISTRSGEADEKLSTLYKKCWREVAENKGTVLKIGPLDETDVLKLVTLKFGQTPNAINFLPWLMTVTEGHPLYLRALLNFKDFQAPEALVEDYALDSALHTLEGLISSKIRHLPEKQLQILEIASCLHGRFTFDLLRKMAEMQADELAPIVWQLIKSQMLTYCNTANNQTVFSHPLLSFTHAIFPEVIRANMLKERRKSIYQKAVTVLSRASASALEYKIPNQVIAATYADLPLEAAKSFRNLSTLSRGRFAPSMAKRSLRMALEQIDALPGGKDEQQLTIQICFDLVRICRIMDGAGHADFREAIQRLHLEGKKLPGVRGQFLQTYAEAMFNIAQGRADLAARNADQLQTLAPLVSDSERFYCLLWIGISRVSEGNIGAAQISLEACLEISNELAHSIELTEAQKIAEAHYLWVLAIAGEYEKSERIMQRIESELHESSGPAQISMTLYWMGEAHRMTGHHGRAIACYEEALEIARLNDFPAYRVACEAGLIACQPPDYRDIPFLEKLLNDLQRDGELWKMCAIFYMICESHLQRKNLEAAHHYLERLQERVGYWGYYASQTDRLRALLAFAEDRPEPGRIWLQKAWQQAQRSQFRLMAKEIEQDAQRLCIDLH